MHSLLSVSSVILYFHSQWIVHCLQSFVCVIGFVFVLCILVSWVFSFSPGNIFLQRYQSTHYQGRIVAIREGYLLGCWICVSWCRCCVDSGPCGLENSCTEYYCLWTPCICYRDGLWRQRRLVHSDQLDTELFWLRHLSLLQWQVASCDDRVDYVTCPIVTVYDFIYL